MAKLLTLFAVVSTINAVGKNVHAQDSFITKRKDNKIIITKIFICAHSSLGC